MKQFTLIGKLISVNGRKVNCLVKAGEIKKGGDRIIRPPSFDTKERRAKGFMG